ncbi:RpiR family carbohydrate utilization transcriptional regulator [Rhizobium azooxidifex]|jgi:RpiR family carbohydrate utilization transcriptional regulator|uniref:RpiR family carbohydrate utilization transcriptional regulator n=1 Tax=Mycoplana azooxidifex TaxID=1636188 RepID=A0A7W6GJ32_9HYPH|nr:SIS domain-containing protein [Mycoplana azooxidifex]MBB3977611.1 RpiR family carbohydrate utilization transcriptional regulator [Mycoplana azooxidifex]
MDSEVRSNSGRNMIEIIRTMRPDLRKSDRKVADIVLEDPHRIMNATVGETAQLADVSQPTVLRFATAIGCSGFQDFKIKLAQSLAFGTPATHSVLLDTDTPEAVTEKIFDYTMTSLDWARSKLDKAALHKAIDALAAARSIVFFGFGASGIVARDAQQKFPLFGVPCVAELDSHQQLMVASMMKPGDVAFVISNTGTTRSIIEIARIARENGATVICLTGSESPLTHYCDVVLIVETLENTNMYTPTISRIAALVVIDILSTSVAMRRPADDHTRIHQMKRQLSDMRKMQPI